MPGAGWKNLGGGARAGPEGGVEGRRETERLTPLQGVWSVVEGGQGWDVTLWKGLGREREWEGLGGVWRPEDPRLLVSGWGACT